MPETELKDGSTTTDPRLDRCVFFNERSRNYRAISLLKVAQIRKPRSRRWKVAQTLDQGREGACHSEDTEVLTHTGWKRWPDCNRSELLGTINPVTHALEFQAPTEWHAFEYDGPMHRIDHSSLDYALTPDHRMMVRRWDERARTLSDGYGFCKISDIGWYSGLMASPSGWVGARIDSLTVGGTHYSGDDFLALVALVISDGWVGSTDNTRNRVSFCCFRDDRYEMVSDLAKRLRIKEQPGRKGVWCFSNHALAEWFRLNAYQGDVYRSPEKRVPSLVHAVTSEQIALFLKFFGDQHVDDKNGRAFFSSSAALIDDLQILLMKIGSRAGVYKRPPRNTYFGDRIVEARNCAADITLNEWSGDRLSIDRKRQTGTDRYKGPVYCATVPNSTLVTRRNRKVLISGNCVGFGISHELIANPAAIQGITNEFARQLYFAAQKLDPWEGGSYPGANPVYEGTAVLAGLKAAQAMQYFDEYRWCFGLDDLLLTVGYIGPVIIGVNWYEGMMDYDANNFIHVSGGIAGGHCTLISGVDVKDEFAEIHNSWNDPRKMKISFVDLNRLLKEEGEAAVPIRRHFTPRPPKHIVT